MHFFVSNPDDMFIPKAYETYNTYYSYIISLFQIWYLKAYETYYSSAMRFALQNQVNSKEWIV